MFASSAAHPLRGPLLAPARFPSAAIDLDAGTACTCGNDDPTLFVEDSRAGDLICKVCGTILSQRRTVDGDWTRGAFADEGDQSQQGPAMQLHHSPQWNLRTTFGEAPGVSKATMSRIHSTWASIDRGQEAGAVRTGGRTTIAYKDKMKSRAFAVMEEAGARLRLHRAVVEAAKALFSGFRDDREQLVGLEPVIMACLAVACARAGISRFKEVGEAHRDAGAAADGSTAVPKTPAGSGSWQGARGSAVGDEAEPRADAGAASAAAAEDSRAMVRRRQLSSKPRFLALHGHRAPSVPDSSLLISKQPEAADGTAAGAAKRGRPEPVPDARPSEATAGSDAAEFGGNRDVLAFLDAIQPDPHAPELAPAPAAGTSAGRVTASSGPSRALSVLSRLRALKGVKGQQPPSKRSK